MEIYVSLNIFCELFTDNNESVCKLWSPFGESPIFGNTMAHDRFEDICRISCFDNRAIRRVRLQNDRIAATGLLLDDLVTNSQKCSIHNDYVTVDEELYPFRGRSIHV